MNFKLISLISLILLLFKIDLTSSECSYEHDIDYKSTNSPIDLNFIFSSSPQDCCKQCSDNPKCKAWTYVTLTKLCWIKNQIGTRTYSTGSKNINR